MPLEVREYTLTSESADYFARALRDHPDLLAGPTVEDDDVRLFEGRFNGRPVALLIAQPDDAGWRLRTLVVHPATRGRGVGAELRRQASTLLGATLTVSPAPGLILED